jgi:hypothetical protein
MKYPVVAGSARVSGPGVKTLYEELLSLDARGLDRTAEAVARTITGRSIIMYEDMAEENSEVELDYTLPAFFYAALNRRASIPYLYIQNIYYWRI